MNVQSGRTLTLLNDSKSLIIVNVIPKKTDYASTLLAEIPSVVANREPLRV